MFGGLLLILAGLALLVWAFGGLNPLFTQIKSIRPSG